MKCAVLPQSAVAVEVPEHEISDWMRICLGNELEKKYDRKQEELG